MFAAGADAALSALPQPVLLDEWQSVPQVLGAVKRAVDTGCRAFELDDRICALPISVLWS